MIDIERFISVNNVGEARGLKFRYRFI